MFRWVAVTKSFGNTNIFKCAIQTSKTDVTLERVPCRFTLLTK